MSTRWSWYLIGLVAVSAHSVDGSAVTGVEIPADVAAAVADPRRPAEQIKLDATRKPGVAIAFAGLRSGDRVVDFMPGNGYFTRILSDVVGPTGHVHAFIPSEQGANCPARGIAGKQALLQWREARRRPLGHRSRRRGRLGTERHGNTASDRSGSHEE